MRPRIVHDVPVHRAGPLRFPLTAGRHRDACVRVTPMNSGNPDASTGQFARDPRPAQELRSFRLDDRAPLPRLPRGYARHEGRDRMLRRLHELMLREDGQDLIEYALLAAFIAIASFAALGALGPVIANFFTSLVPLIENA